MHTVKQTLLLALIFALAGCATDRRHLAETAIPNDKPAYQAPRGQYLSRVMSLYSVNFRSQGWRFLLMPDEFSPGYPGNYGNLYRAEELQRAFRGLPSRACVVWRDDIYNAWIYPPQALQERVANAAKAVSVQLQILPTLVCP